MCVCMRERERERERERANCHCEREHTVSQRENMLSRYKYGSCGMSACERGREQHLSLSDLCHLCV